MSEKIQRPSYDFGGSSLDIPLNDDDDDQNSKSRFIGPLLYRQEMIRIERQGNAVSDKSSNGRGTKALKLLVDEHTQAWHVLKTCASKNLVPASANIQDEFELVLVGIASPLPRGYLCFEHWDMARLWKEPYFYSVTGNSDDEADDRDFASYGTQPIINQTSVASRNSSSILTLPKDVKVTDISNDDIAATIRSNMRQAYHDVFTLNDNKALNDQTALCRVNTLPFDSCILHARDKIQKSLKYTTEDAWEEYELKGNKKSYDHNSDFALDVRWFIQHKSDPPIILTGELSGEESSDDECEGFHASERLSLEIDSESDERYLRHILVKKASRSKISMQGFLLKQDDLDLNVWRRLWCILVDGQLWFISRMRQRSITASDGSRRYIWKSKHQSLQLLRSHVTDQENNCVNKNVPYAFEVRTLQGQVHAFQAGSRQEQLKWIQATASEIITNHENNYIEMAELIIGDEQDARTRRFEESVNNFLKVTQIPKHRGSNLWSMSGAGGEIVDLTRFTMLINEFIEVRRNYAGNPCVIGSRQWALNRISIARQLDAAGAVCASPFFRERTFDDDEFKTKRKYIVHLIIEKQKRLNQTDDVVEPLPSNIFDEILVKLTHFAAYAEKAHKENGLFGY